MPSANGPSASELEQLFKKLEPDTTTYMSKYDGGHDMNHIRRVLKNAMQVLAGEQARNPDKKYDYSLICYAALLHDVGDKKYAHKGEDVSRMVENFILSRVDDPERYRSFAEKVQKVATYVSFSTENKDPQRTKDVIAEIPELAIVQDADRLDSIGAVGIGRSFSYAEARHYGMQDGVDQFYVKLLKIEPLMKTETGKEIAKTRHERLNLFADWWSEESPADENFGFDTVRAEQTQS